MDESTTTETEGATVHQIRKLDEYELLAMSTIARLVKEDGDGATPIDAAVALLAAAMRERDESSRSATVYIRAPSKAAIDTALEAALSKTEPCTLCARPIFSVRQAIAETDLPGDTGSAAAIRELWRRLTLGDVVITAEMGRRIAAAFEDGS